MRLVIGVLAALAVVAVTPAQRRVWIVDPTNGPGTHFRTVQAGADAAAPGDVLLLRSNGGWLGPLTTSKPLSLLADAGHRPYLGATTIHDLAPCSTFVIAGVVLAFPLPSTPAVRLSACAGQVLLRNVRVSGRPPTLPGFAIEATDCRCVDVVDLATSCSRGLLALRSSVTLVDSVCRIDVYEHAPSYGDSMIDAGQSDLFLVDVVCHGGNGGILGGHAVRLVDGTFRLGGTRVGGSWLQAGQGGTREAVTLVRGMLRWDPATTTIARGAASTGGSVLAETVPVAHGGAMLGGMATATLSAPVGTPALLAFGLPGPPIPTGSGTLRVDLAHGLCALVAGTTSSAGTLSIVEAVPNDPNLLGAVFLAQGAAASSMVGPRLTNGASFVLQ